VSKGQSIKVKKLPSSAGSRLGRVAEETPEANDTLTLCNSDTSFPKLIVFGCLAKRYKGELIKEIPEIDAIFGVTEEEKIVEYCKGIQASKGLAAFSAANPPERGGESPRRTGRPIHPFTSYSYLKIAEGCSRKCAYCVIPSIRGEYKSAAPDEILRNAEEHIKSGLKELILIAQDTASYGREFKDYDIANLLKDLCSISGDFWIRLLYAYPASITDSLLKVIAGEDKICKYLDMPFQHSEDRILKLMKRGGSRKGYLNLIKKIRRAVPDPALRTTFIVGFPSETEDEFKSMMDFIEEAQFDRLGAFKYSKEEGTPAALLKGPLPVTVKNKRIAEIMQRQERISFEKNKKLVGRRFRAIVDEIEQGVAIARLYSHAPEIDGVVIIDESIKGSPHSGGFVASSDSPRRAEAKKGQSFKAPIHPFTDSPIHPFTHSPVRAGDFVTVEITDAYDYDLKGKIVK